MIEENPATACFRGFAAAAPLKVVGEPGMDVVRECFRGFAAAAPLKAAVAHAGQADDQLPRLRSRGSIEGRRSVPRSASTSGFRGFAAAAPLKVTG